MQIGPRAVNRQHPIAWLSVFIHYIQHLLTHVVDMPYSYNTQTLKHQRLTETKCKCAFA